VRSGGGFGVFWCVLAHFGGFWWLLVRSRAFWWAPVGSGGFWWFLVGILAGNFFHKGFCKHFIPKTFS
jgi:hypothetical protein